MLMEAVHRVLIIINLCRQCVVCIQQPRYRVGDKLVCLHVPMYVTGPDNIRNLANLTRLVASIVRLEPVGKIISAFHYHLLPHQCVTTCNVLA